MKPSFSTKNMHIVIFEDDPSLARLPEKDFDRLTRAVGEAISQAKTRDVVTLVTFCSDVFLSDDQTANLIDFIKFHKEFDKLVAAFSDVIMFKVKRGFVVTVRMFGTDKKFVVADIADEDSFESVEDLTQRVGGLSTNSNHYATPRK
jgi:hypothetical protein